MQEGFLTEQALPLKKMLVQNNTEGAAPPNTAVINV